MSALSVAGIVLGTAALTIVAYDVITRKSAAQTAQTKTVADTPAADTTAVAPTVVMPYGLPYNVWGSDWPVWRHRRYNDDGTQIINNNNNNNTVIVPPTTQTPTTQTPSAPAPTTSPQVPLAPVVTTQSTSTTQTSGLSQLHPRIGAVVSTSIHRAKHSTHHPQLFHKEKTNYSTGINDHSMF